MTKRNLGIKDVRQTKRFYSLESRLMMTMKRTYFKKEGKTKGRFIRNEKWGVLMTQIPRMKLLMWEVTINTVSSSH